MEEMFILNVCNIWINEFSIEGCLFKQNEKDIRKLRYSCCTEIISKAILSNGTFYKTKFFHLILKIIYFKLYKMSNFLCGKFVAITPFFYHINYYNTKIFVVILSWSLCCINRYVCHKP